MHVVVKQPKRKISEKGSEIISKNQTEILKKLIVRTLAVRLYAKITHICVFYRILFSNVNFTKNAQRHTFRE